MIKYTTEVEGLTLAQLKEGMLRMRDEFKANIPLQIRSCDRIPAGYPVTTRILMKNTLSTKFAFYTYIHGYYYVFRNGMTLAQLKKIIQDNDIEQLQFSCEQKFKKGKKIACKIAVNDVDVLTLRGT